MQLLHSRSVCVTWSARGEPPLTSFQTRSADTSTFGSETALFSSVQPAQQHWIWEQLFGPRLRLGVLYVSCTRSLRTTPPCRSSAHLGICAFNGQTALLSCAARSASWCCRQCSGPRIQYQARCGSIQSELRTARTSQNATVLVGRDLASPAFSSGAAILASWVS